MPVGKKMTPFKRRFSALVAMGEVPTNVVRQLRPEVRDPGSYASRLMALEPIKERIAKLEEAAIKAAGVTHAGIVRDIIAVKDRCMQAEPVLDRDGKPTGEWVFREMGALKAIEMLGKYAKLWENESNGNTTVNDNRVVVQVIKFADHPDSAQVATASLPAPALGLPGAGRETL